MTRALRTAATLAVLATLAGLGGCGDDDPAASGDYPDGTVVLQQNVPQKVGDYRLIAINVDTDRGTVVVEPPSGGHDNLPVRPGATVQSGGLTLDVVAIEPPKSDAGAPGKDSGVIVVVPST